MVKGNTGLIDTWVIGFFTEFSHKEEIKEFTQSKGGNWNGHYRFWFVPLIGETMKEKMEYAWKLLLEFQDLGLMSTIAVDVQISEKAIEWFTKKAKIANSGMAIASPSAQPIAQVVVDRIEQEEDDYGQIVYERIVGKVFSNGS